MFAARVRQLDWNFAERLQLPAWMIVLQIASLLTAACQRVSWLAPLHAREGTPMTKILSLMTRGVAVLALVVTAFVSNIGTYALGVAGITTIAMTTTSTPASAQRWRRWRFRRWRRRWW
jgi:hypothetical protein